MSFAWNRMFVWSRIFVGLLVVFAASSQCDESAHGFQVGSPVKTTSGTIHGHRAPNATQVSEYLGIPFGVPPLGDLRFAPPVRYLGNGTVSGDTFAHDCASTSSTVPSGVLPQSAYNLLADLGQVGDDQHEDCLYVNVWSKPQFGSPRKPVLIWIYGGGFNSGGTNTSSYSGQFWADTEDVVFVNFNYRLNIFGFPGAPGITQNVGFLDQRLALEWVRDNIEAFGGDPSRIIIFGQSAGSASVDYYNYAWTEDPIVAGSILESGTAMGFGNKLPESANHSWYMTAQKAGCDTSQDPDSILSCMRGKSMSELLQAESAGGGLASILGNFTPTIDNRTVFYNYTERGLAKQFVQAPMLIGNNYFEAGLFQLFAIGMNITEEQWLELDAGSFNCPSSTSAEYRVMAGLPVWRYIYNGIFPNLEFPIDTNTAYHGAEILPLFGTSETVTKQDSTWQERSMGSYMRGAWAAFAANPSSGLAQYGWTRYSNTTRSLLQLGFDDSRSLTYNVIPTLNTSMAIDGLCGSFPFMGSPNL